MNPILKNVLAVVIGAVVGSLVNGALIAASPHIIPPPANADFTTMEGLKANFHLMQPKHFMMPFLAHALGTLIGALITTKIATPLRGFTLAMVLGGLFFIGGLINILMLPSPMWFTLLDLGVAYIPMAYIGYYIAKK